MTGKRMVVGTLVASALFAGTALAQGDDCDDTTTTTTTVVTTTIPGPVDPIPEPHPVPTQDYCIDENGDGVGAWALAAAVCFTTEQARLWVETVSLISARYGVAIQIAEQMLINLLTHP